MNLMKPHHLIFAYGLMLDAGVMADRCPDAIYAGRAQLHGYRFKVCRHGPPTLEPAASRAAYGVLWWIDSDELFELDYFEGVDQFFTVRRKVNVVDESQSIVRAEAYIAKAIRPGPPMPDCLHAIIRAASRRAFPEPYIKELQGWLEKID
jgi:gamma-glutamylcyclotransferase (GGCT)/AIG2-like uncharacterized protein YtfP